ncbi:Histidine kinase-, DNA gyrase B-, and HSP90-like ATPase [Chishuiella changwenlii]|uniref:ATPase n=1 Tax=Chishuiella changwenlii TaxID=1434701 RepID=A0A1M7A2C4_9FLAO|nr:ATP-binding protein [Chishuiella changwenlii]GGE91832.1 ATPase [Chishuiella changwenlii]SHL36901.1 Histidine kinase-, DNA gyrase B-, and HSP90-like ATPase [Chishuiella changwenlii]
MKEFKAEIAQPNPKSTINSYRSFGYNLSTAIADIIDNSISANAKEISISYKWNGQDSFISIKDNGDGMNKDELVLAMTPGSKDPEDERLEKDLGRFGMGLKTASFSQCKRLTCISKRVNFSTVKRCWDIDFINSEEKWQLLDYISDSSLLDEINRQKSGTLVLWEKLDRIVGNAESNNESVKNAFYQEMENVREHLSLVFHKFVESKRIKIFFQNEQIEAYNPFLLNLDPKPEMGLSEKFENVEITYFILPHMSEIGKEDYDKTGGSLGWFQQQGFYIYRGDRLLVAGDWLRLEKKRDYAKLARISVNFSNSNDFNWNLDIKKSTATPPIEIRRELLRIAKIAIMKSAKIYNWRGQKTFSENKNSTFEPLWMDEITREGIKKYKINRKHPIINSLLTDKNKLMSKALQLLEENIPIELILTNQNEDPAFHELEKHSEIPSDDLLNLAVELYKIYVQQGIPESLAKQQIMSSMPFNLFPLINDYL